MARPVAVLALAALVAVISGCSEAESEAGFGLPTLDSEEAAAVAQSAGVPAGSVGGALAVESNGCFTWRSDDEADGAWLVWPDDARQDGDAVVLGEGARITDGARIAGSGAVVSLADLPDGANADSYFGSFGGFCDADSRGALVLLEVAPE
ncbi:hypothetical protein ABZ477_01795 [Microbacterium sp. NPDC019599]|uniref:hypothetical protein n=1 Tax=Microbacterium sp. NPDC019599 TaxID=3154690 RepID=UPI0034095A2B